MEYEFDEHRWGLRRIELPARRIIDSGLGRGRSVIDPVSPAWSAPVVAELRERIVDKPDTGGDKFLAKLRGQLAGAPREVLLLAAELLALHALPLGNLHGSKKLSRVTTVLSWAHPRPEVPADLRAGLEGPSVFNGGLGFNVKIWQQLSWLLALVAQWHQLDAKERTTALQDPWRFREFVHQHDTGQRAIRNSLLYLAFPDVFLPIASQEHKVAIHKAFVTTPSGSDPISVDRDLHEVHREHQEQAGGERVHYYHGEWPARWQKPKPSNDTEPRRWLLRCDPVAWDVWSWWSNGAKDPLPWPVPEDHEDMRAGDHFAFWIAGGGLYATGRLASAPRVTSEFDDYWNYPPGKAHVVDLEFERYLFDNPAEIAGEGTALALGAEQWQTLSEVAADQGRADPPAGTEVVITSRPLGSVPPETVTSVQSHDTVITFPEAQLVLDYQAHLGRDLHCRVALLPSGERLVCDAFDDQEQMIIEAKSSAGREHVRMAVGQLLDYRHHLAPEAAIAVLLPERPKDSIVAVLQAHDIKLIHRNGASFTGPV